jgi:ABC-type multidrug transport system permease subunit
MRQLSTDIIIFLGLVLISLIALLLTAGQSTIDIQLHDTYFVIDKLSMTTLIIGPLTFLIFLARALARKFKTKGSNIGLIMGLILVAAITFYLVQLQQSYLNEMMRFDDEGLPDRGQFIVDTKNRINWTWGLFGFWAMALSLLTLRTIKIWKKDTAANK